MTQLLFATLQTANLIVGVLLLVTMVQLMRVNVQLRVAVQRYVDACRELGRIPNVLDPPPTVRMWGLVVTAFFIGFSLARALR